MAVTSLSKMCIEVNDKICEILGYERSELLQMSWAEITHPDDLAADVVNFNRLLAGEIDGYAMDKRWIRKDGRIIYSTISVKCLRDADGSVDHYVALLQDITERKRAEEALETANDTLERRVAEQVKDLTALNEALTEANERVTEILESITDAFSFWDQNCRFIYVNDRAAHLLGKAKDQLIGQCVWDLFPEVVGTNAYENCQRAM